MAETVLVTGGTGFVAGWCAVELLKRGYAVRATIRSQAKEAAARAAIESAAGETGRLSFVVVDLMDDRGWAEAARGCDYVLHVASPLAASGGDADALVRPAREGALRVLRAAFDAGVGRVVMTSSCAAATPTTTGLDTISDETVWGSPEHQQNDHYRLSKTLAEKAAWDYAAERGATDRLVTILPSGVFGPVLTTENLGSVQFIQRLLDGRAPRVPRVGLNIVDVRDLAEAHILAMTAPEAAGERFIANGDFMWMAEIAATLKDRLGEQAAKVPTRGLPDAVVNLGAFVYAPLRTLKPLIGRSHRFDSTKARRVLGWSSRPATETVVDCARSLLAQQS